MAYKDYSYRLCCIDMKEIKDLILLNKNAFNQRESRLDLSNQNEKQNNKLL